MATALKSINRLTKRISVPINHFAKTMPVMMLTYIADLDVKGIKWSKIKHIFSPLFFWARLREYQCKSSKSIDRYLATKQRLLLSPGIMGIHRLFVPLIDTANRPIAVSIINAQLTTPTSNCLTMYSDLWCNAVMRDVLTIVFHILLNVLYRVLN